MNDNVQPLNHIHEAIVTEYQVQLKGAFEGSYKVTVIHDRNHLGDHNQSKIYAWSGTTELVFITNFEIINLLKEAIQNR
jgi:hypothetical protein